MSMTAVYILSEKKFKMYKIFGGPKVLFNRPINRDGMSSVIPLAYFRRRFDEFPSQNAYRIITLLSFNSVL